MTTYYHDGTFDGLLSAVFEAYWQRDSYPCFAPAGTATGVLFSDPIDVVTEPAHVQRVRAGIKRCGGAETELLLYHAFLSEAASVEAALFGYLRLLFSEGVEAAENPLLPAGPRVRQLARRVSREVHRMHAFVRFAEREDGLWQATVEPECNVLPLIGAHFCERYGALRWLIVDARRHQALFHDAGRVRLVDIPAAPADLAADEHVWQLLWQAYYHAVSIAERRNLQLRAQHMPRRYWKHLPEMQQPEKT